MTVPAARNRTSEPRGALEQESMHRVTPGRYTARLTSVVALLLLMACGGAKQVADSDDVETLYRDAMRDARTAEASEIVTTLTPLTPYNDRLVWRTAADSTRHVLVATWGAEETVPGATAGDTIVAEEDVWVTVVPHVRRFCRELEREGEALDLRLAQRLGLPPDVEYEQFAELWVEPSALVRPCPDPEVSDRECELSTPVPSNHVEVSRSHRQWFQHLRHTSYGPEGYPFTGLGYTYDWNPANDEVGLSEFVLRMGKTAVVRRVAHTEAYCRAR